MTTSISTENSGNYTITELFTLGDKFVITAQTLSKEDNIHSIVMLTRKSKTKAMLVDLVSGNIVGLPVRVKDFKTIYIDEINNMVFNHRLIVNPCNMYGNCPYLKLNQ